MRIEQRLEEADESGINMTPMIDVVFLLIVFFMVVTEISNRSLSNGIILPRADQSVEDEGANRLVVNVDRNGTFAIRGVAYSKSALDSAVQGYALVRTEPDKTRVMIRADRKTKYRAVEDLLEVLQNNRIWQIAFAAEKD